MFLHSYFNSVCFHESEEGATDSKRKLRFRGVYYRNDGGGAFWFSRGYVNGKQMHFASGNTEEECAEKARKKVTELRLIGKKVAANYGSALVNDKLLSINGSV